MGEIETARKEDFDAIAALNVQAYAEFAPHLHSGAWDVMRGNLQNIAERSQKADFIVYRQGSQVIGSIAYCPAGQSDPAIFGPGMASVLLLAVDPEHRGRGIGKALTEACIARACIDKAASLGLFTSELMQAAQHVYRSLGFVQDIELSPRHGIRYFRFVLKLAS